MTELRLLLFDDSLHLGLKLGSLELLEQVCLLLDALSLIVPLHSDQLGLSVAELEQILTELHLLLELGADLLLVVLELDHVLLFQLFQRQVSRRFVVRHIVVPGLRKLKELGFLSRLDVL